MKMISRGVSLLPCLTMISFGLAKAQLPFTEDFTSFTAAGFASSPSAGQLDSNVWRVTGASDGDATFGGDFASGDFARGTSGGGVSTGGIYAFDVGSGNIALGFQPGGSDLTPGTITLKITNDSGQEVTSVDVSYTIYVNSDATRASSLNFAFSTDDSTYTPVGALDFTSPEAADANGFTSVSRSTTGLAVTVPNGQSLFLQWQTNDVSGTNTRDELAIDDISVAVSGAPAQSTTPGIPMSTTTTTTTTTTPPPTVRIFDIQGASQVSPLLLQAGGVSAGEFLASGQTIPTVNVRTNGIVTAVDSNGFYLQDPAGDDDDATSDGIFVFTQSTPTVAVGDNVDVEGEVSEFFAGGRGSRNIPITQISGGPTVTVNSSGNALPDPVIIGNGGRMPPNQQIDSEGTFSTFDIVNDGIDFFESLEGMRVLVQDAVAIQGTNRFGEIFTVVDSGASATGLNSRRALVVSPGDFNPEKIQIDFDGGILSGFTFPDVNAGDSLGDVIGVVTYGFGNFEVAPTEPFSTSSFGLQPQTTTLSGGSNKLLIATYNILNLDPNDSDGDTDIADGRFDAIASQIVNNLKNPDVIGLQEVQDNSGSVDDGTVAADMTLQMLVDAIAAAGGPTYSFVDNTFITDDKNGGQPGGNIRCTYLYNAARVTFVTSEPVSDQNNGSPFDGARLPLAATFMFNGEEFTVVNNQFSSKGGSAPILGIEQPFEQRQEDIDVNGSLDERQEQSSAVQSFVNNIFAENSDANVIVLGDLNEFDFVSPVEDLKTTGLENLIETLPRRERYTFNFQGNSQVLDHILVSPSLTSGAELEVVHVNVEFAELDTRASDHDPVLAVLTIGDNNGPLAALFNFFANFAGGLFSGFLSFFGL